MIQKATLTILAVFIAVLTYAQVSYTYDNAGNRIKREITIDKSAEMSADSTLANEAVVSNNSVAIEFTEPALEEVFGELEVRLYPNPTKGAVYIQLNRMPHGGKPMVEVWSPNGRLIGKSEITGQVTRINLWGKPSGMYILKTILGGNPVSWKIIKE